MALGQEHLRVVVAGYARAVGYGVGHHARIRAAAHRVGLVVAAGDVLVELLQGDHACVVLGYVEGLGVAYAHYGIAAARPVGLEGREQPLLVYLYRGAAVHAHGEHAVPEMRHAVYQRQLARYVVGEGHALALAVGIGGQLLEVAYGVRAAAGEQRCLVQRAGEQRYRVYAAVGRSRMAGLAVGDHARAALAGFGGYAGAQLAIQPVQRGGHSPGLQREHALGAVGYHVAHGAGVKGGQRAAAVGAYLGVDRALLAVVDGEARVRHQRGLGEDHAALAQLDHVLHARLLAQAAYQAQSVAERPAEVAQHAHREQSGHRRALVVAHAAPHERVVLGQVCRPELGVYPAVAHGHHVQMPYDAQRVGIVAHVNGARVTIVIYGLKAVVAAALQRRFQHPAAFRAEGRARLGQIGAAHGGYARPGLYFFNELLPVRAYPFVGAREQLFYLGFHVYHSFRKAYRLRQQL